MRIFVFLFFVLVTVSAGAAAPSPVSIILDTDISNDVDDVGAVAVLHALASRGEARILATGVCVQNPWSPLCLDALNTWFGRPEIPLGVVKGPAYACDSKYAEQIAREFPHALKSADDAPDAALLYRQVLARQPDRSVIMASIGMLTNFRNLLKTGPDQFSPLDGVALVQQKVRAWVCIGAKFPAGRETNMFADAPAAAYAIEHWPTPIIFSGYELGKDIITGPGLRTAPAGNPVRRAYELFNGLTDHPSWDQTAVLYAVRGLDGGLADYWDLHAKGWLHIDEDGRNLWHDAPDKDQTYLVQKKPPQEIAAVIEELMRQPPATRR